MIGDLLLCKTFGVPNNHLDLDLQDTKLSNYDFSANPVSLPYMVRKVNEPHT